MPFEVASACLKKLRRHPAIRDGLIAAFGILPSLGIRLMPVDQPAALLLAEKT